MTTNFISWF